MSTENSQKKKLFSLVVEDNDNLVSEYGWINPTEFCVWIRYADLADFINALNDIFGIGLFDDGGIIANMQDDCLCFDLCELLGGYFPMQDVFSYNYKH